MATKQKYQQVKGRYPKGSLMIHKTIIDMKDIKWHEKALLAYIYNFGQPGCYALNSTLAEIFNVTAGTISTWVKDIKKHLSISDPYGLRRNMRCNFHPDVRAVQKGYMKRQQHEQAIKDTTNRYSVSPNLRKNQQEPTDNSVGTYGRINRQPTDNSVTYKKEYKKIDNTEMSADGLSSPEGNEATTKKEVGEINMQSLTASFCKDGKSAAAKLSASDIQAEKQRQKEALEAVRETK